MFTALFGKMLVYTVLFSVMGLILVLLMYDWMHFPIAGSIWNMFLAIVLLVLASESVAVFIIGLLPVPRLALSIGALYSVMAFSMSGFTLPVETMPPYMQGLAHHSEDSPSIHHAPVPPAGRQSSPASAYVRTCTGNRTRI